MEPEPSASRDTLIISIFMAGMVVLAVGLLVLR